MVSFTYIVVSKYLNGAYTDIWATVASIENPSHDTPQAIDGLGGSYTTDPNAAGGSGTCAIFTDPDISHDYGATGSCEDSAVDSNGVDGGMHIVHAYIMGFRFNPAIQTTPDSYLYAGVLPGGQYPADPDSYEFTDDPTAPFGTVNIVYNANPAPPPGTPVGPQVSFYNPGLAVTFIKVAFVHSRFDYARTLPAAVPLYPAGSNMLYSSSYVFTDVTQFNTAVAITRGGTGQFSQFYHHLPDARYAIYGLTTFDLPQGAGCTTILVNATLDSIDAFTVTTPNLNPANMFFVADIFTKNIDQLCQPGNNALLASQIFTVGKKSFFTIPTQSQEQYILE